MRTYFWAMRAVKLELFGSFGVVAEVRLPTFFGFEV